MDATHGGGPAPVDPLENNRPRTDAFSGRIKLAGRLDPAPGDNIYGDVWGDGNHAYVCGLKSETIFIIDIADPRSPKLAGVYTTGNGRAFMGDVQARNGIGYFASFQFDPGAASATGVHIVDCSNPAQPVLISRIAAKERGHQSVHNLFVSGKHLYTADHATPQVKVFDVSDPSAPRFVRNIQTTDPENIHDLTVFKGRLYVSGWSGLTQIYDISNVEAAPPARLASFATGVTSHSSWVTEDETILATCAEYGPKDLRIFNMTNLTRPTRLATYSSRTLGVDAVGPHIPVIFGRFLFVSWYQAGLQVFDLRNPARPARAGWFDTFPGGQAGAESFDGCIGVYPFLGLDRVLVSDMDNGLFIVDASALDAPDEDGDGMPDEWEAKHGLSASNAGDAGADKDGDGASNLDEFLAGTDPGADESSLRVLGMQKVGADVHVTFSSEPGRAYSLQRTAVLDPGFWTVAHDEIMGHEGSGTGIHKGGAGQRSFFRVIVHP